MILYHGSNIEIGEILLAKICRKYVGGMEVRSYDTVSWLKYRD